MRSVDLKAELRARLPEILPNQAIGWVKEGRILRIEWNDCKEDFEPILVPSPGLAVLKEIASRAEGNGKSRAPHPLLVAPFLGEEARRMCREKGLQFLDLSGNVWIERKGLLIEKEVPRSRYSLEAVHRSPFADRASLVLRHLLGVAGASAGVREIAAAVGVSAGYVSKILREAEEARYVSRGEDDRFEIRNPRELLADWSSFYQWRKNSCESLFAAPDRNGSIDELMADALRSVEGYMLSLHAGNNQVEPFAQSTVWHLYVESDAVAQSLKERLKLRPAPRDAGNVALLRPYYRVSAFHGARVVKGLRVASDLQLYLDLHDYPIRGAEAAEEILRRRLALAWKSEGGRARI